MTDTATAQRRAPPVPSDRARRAGARPDEPEPARGRACVVKDGRVIGEGFHAPPASRTPSARRSPPRRRGPGRRRRCTSRSSRAATRPHAAVHRRDRRGRHRARRGRLRRPDRARPPAAAWASCATRASTSTWSTATSPRARPPAQPALPQARPDRPPAGAVQVRDDARRQGRHPHRRLASGSPARRAAPRAHRWRAECDAVAVGIGTALADDPLLTARVEGVARQPRRVVFDSEARLPLDSQLVRGAREVPLDLVVLARRAARLGRGARGGRRRGDRRHRRERGGARAHALDELGARGVQSLLLEGGPHLAGAFLDAGEIDEVRLFVAPLLLGGRDARDRARGRGRRARSPARARALAIEVRADRGRRADHARA